jgi:hypothetical protein
MIEIKGKGRLVKNKLKPDMETSHAPTPQDNVGGLKDVITLFKVFRGKDSTGKSENESRGQVGFVTAEYKGLIYYYATTTD